MRFQVGDWVILHYFGEFDTQKIIDLAKGDEEYHTVQGPNSEGYLVGGIGEMRLYNYRLLTEEEKAEFL